MLCLPLLLLLLLVAPICPILLFIARSCCASPALEAETVGRGGGKRAGSGIRDEPDDGDAGGLTANAGFAFGADALAGDDFAIAEFGATDFPLEGAAGFAPFEAPVPALADEAVAGVLRGEAVDAGAVDDLAEELSRLPGPVLAIAGPDDFNCPGGPNLLGKRVCPFRFPLASVCDSSGVKTHATVRSKLKKIELALDSVIAPCRYIISGARWTELIVWKVRNA